MFKPWMLAAMEEEGHTDTKVGHINRVAKYIAAHYTGTIGDAEFEETCNACGIDIGEFEQEDIEKIQEIINK